MCPLEEEGVKEFLIALLVLADCMNSAPGAQFEFEFNQLPKEVRETVRDIRAACKELGADDPYAPDAGIQLVDLDGRGSRDILLDAEHVCSDWIKGGNCSNRGCDLMIWKQTDKNSWKKVFDEHLVGGSKFISIDRDNRRFRWMAVSIYAGDPR
jgi:hypothetical protein